MTLDTNIVEASKVEVGYRVRKWGRETDPFSRVKRVTPFENNGRKKVAITTVHWQKVFEPCDWIEVFIHD